jgi:hypothetical protein
MNFIDKPIDIGGSQQTAAVGQKVVNLALQGGGSRGAFTWGVLDRLLEECGEGTETAFDWLNALLIVALEILHSSHRTSAADRRRGDNRRGSNAH